MFKKLLVSASLLIIQVDAFADTCVASDLSSLRSCIAGATQPRTISLANDMSCTGGDCCDNNANSLNIYMLRISHANSLTIDGNGHTITRHDKTKVCPAIRIDGDSTNIILKNLKINDRKPTNVDSGIPSPIDPQDTRIACVESELTNTCKPTIEITSAHNTTLDNVTVANGKGYVVSVAGTNGFVFNNSKIFDAGVIGLYVGKDEHGIYSNGVSITNSTFMDTGTNAVALDGVNYIGISNKISNNLFLRNHRFGVWKDPNFTTPTRPFYPGGQIYIPEASNLDISNNTIGDGYCSNCVRSAVTGIELARPATLNPIQGISISNNTIYNQQEYPIYVNDYYANGTNTERSTNSTQLKISGNKYLNNGTSEYGYQNRIIFTDNMPSNEKMAHTMKNTGFENDDDIKNGEASRQNQFVYRSNLWPTNWSTWNQCESDASIVRWQVGEPEAMMGSYALRMMTNGFTCNDGWQGIWTEGFFTEIRHPGLTYFGVNAWVRNGNWSGKTCLVFLAGNFTEVSQSCVDHHTDNPVWRYRGIDFKWVQSPPNAAYVVVKFGATSPNGFVDVDNVRLSWGEFGL